MDIRTVLSSTNGVSNQLVSNRFGAFFGDFRRVFKNMATCRSARAVTLDGGVRIIPETSAIFL